MIATVHHWLVTPGLDAALLNQPVTLVVIRGQRSRTSGDIGWQKIFSRYSMVLNVLTK